MWLRVRKQSVLIVSAWGLMSAAPASAQASIQSLGAVVIRWTSIGFFATRAQARMKSGLRVMFLQ